MLDSSPSRSNQERRFQGDRRARHTSLGSIFRLRGRRRSFRRLGEKENQYVDCPSRRTVILALSIVVLSLLDALFTLLHLEQGGREINPAMALILAFGISPFLITKTVLTNLGVIFLTIHENFRIGRRALDFAAALYSLLLVYHAVLIVLASG